VILLVNKARMYPREWLSILVHGPIRLKPLCRPFELDSEWFSTDSSASLG
jgi:hypothetical protein